MNVKACPTCGMEIEQHCYHEPEEEVPCVEMPVRDAALLALAWARGLLREAEHYAGQVTIYHERLSDGER